MKKSSDNIAKTIRACIQFEGPKREKGQHLHLNISSPGNIEMYADELTDFIYEEVHRNSYVSVTEPVIVHKEDEGNSGRTLIVIDMIPVNEVSHYTKRMILKHSGQAHKPLISALNKAIAIADDCSNGSHVSEITALDEILKSYA